MLEKFESCGDAVRRQAFRSALTSVRQQDRDHPGRHDGHTWTDACVVIAAGRRFPIGAGA
jgi:hypothetical protein